MITTSRAPMPTTAPKSFPSLALVLHVGINGQGMPGHTEKREQGDQQTEQDAAVIGVVFDRLDQPGSLSARRRFHGREFGKSQAWAEYQQQTDQALARTITQVVFQGGQST